MNPSLLPSPAIGYQSRCFLALGGRESDGRPFQYLSQEVRDNSKMESEEILKGFRIAPLVPSRRCLVP